MYSLVDVSGAWTLSFVSSKELKRVFVDIAEVKKKMPITPEWQAGIRDMPKAYR